MALHWVEQERPSAGLGRCEMVLLLHGDLDEALCNSLRYCWKDDLVDYYYETWSLN